MREIRFRYYNDYWKVMVYDNEDDSSGYWDGAVDSTLGMLNGLAADIPSLMQYTGLKDMNGVEIYEGDVVKAEMDFGPAGYAVRTSVIKYDCINGYEWQYYNLNSIEVIGNIYENPELLQ